MCDPLEPRSGFDTIGLVTHGQVEMPAPPPTSIPRTSNVLVRMFSFALVAILVVAATGCREPSPIEIYTIPTKIPEQLVAGKDRMLAAMVPKGDSVWFFKVNGPEAAVDGIESAFRKFVETIQFEDGFPILTDLPEDWTRGANREMRYATILINTPNKQLDLSVSSLPRQGDWDAQVKMNVNRWRGQQGLASSDDKWAEGEALTVAAADRDGVWVDLLGESGGAAPMSAPLMQPPLLS